MKDKARLMKIVIIEMDIVKRTYEFSFRDVDLDIRRDRKAEFEPKIVKKYETVCNELDKNNFAIC